MYHQHNKQLPVSAPQPEHDLHRRYLVHVFTASALAAIAPSATAAAVTAALAAAAFTPAPAALTATVTPHHHHLTTTIAPPVVHPRTHRHYTRTTIHHPRRRRLRYRRAPARGYTLIRLLAGVRCERGVCSLGRVSI